MATKPKTYTIASNGLPTPVPFGQVSFLVPGVDAHAGLKSGQDVTFTNADGATTLTGSLVNRRMGTLAELINGYGGSHYAVAGKPFDLALIAEELEACYGEDDSGLQATDVRRLYTLLTLNVAQTVASMGGYPVPTA